MKATIFFLMLFIALGGAAQNVNLSGGVVFEGEPYMLVDPGNPRHIVVAWMGYVPLSKVCIKVKATYDGGASWSSAAVIPHFSTGYTSADVSLDADHNGNIYLCYIDHRESPDSGGVFIRRSTDGGLTWGSASRVIDAWADGSKLPLDRPWLAIARKSGATPDTLYVTTKPAPWVPAPNRPYFMRSWNSGATWTSWQYIDSTGYRVGNFIQAPMASPAIDSAGRFHCAYPTYNPSEATYPRFIMATSGNSTSTFRYDTIMNIRGWGTNDTLAKTGLHLACDPAHNSRMAFTTIGTASSDIDIYCLQSANGGSSWTAPVRVNDDSVGNGKMQDMAWCNYDQQGNLVVAWRDRRRAPGTGYAQAAEVWAAIKWRDSASFSRNFVVSDTLAQYDSIYLYGSGNDFLNVALAQDTLCAVWGDVRTGVLNIWFSRVNARTGSTLTVQQLVSEPLPQAKLYPNPASRLLTVEGDGLQQLFLFDMAGHRVLNQPINSPITHLQLPSLPSGSYQATIRTRTGDITQTLLLQR
ncbi:MAG: T9SS C-terminal target domain-containing protein [Chitinophagia bacterium]|nr:T9SS C-terminal target domain-containing protein [Chitinophagia bacterium]